MNIIVYVPVGLVNIPHTLEIDDEGVSNVESIIQKVNKFLEDIGENWLSEYSSKMIDIDEDDGEEINLSAPVDKSKSYLVFYVKN
jgi:hypothetical protein